MSICQLKNVGKSYGSGKHVSQVLNDINLDIKEGEAVGKTFSVTFIATGKLLGPDKNRLESMPIEYKIIGVTNGLEAIEVALNNPEIDMVFMDIQMIVLIVLSLMLIIKIVYLVVFKRLKRHDNDHSQHSNHCRGRHHD